MCRTFVYRGPDGDGIYTGCRQNHDGAACHFGLGHRRLSIIDLSQAGHQPMCNEDGTVWIVYNGEIYGYHDIRKALIEKGHRFKSNTDTEVIVHLYEEEGTDAVKRLNGMFAFALWDERIGRLWLCRDRLGIKPLVYRWDGKTLTFGSEIKALLATFEDSKELDETALQLYMAFSYVPAPHTIFKNIRKLGPGKSLIYENGEVEMAPYWSVPSAASDDLNRLPPGELVRVVTPRLVDTLNRAVADRMIADVPLGAFLSGGIDSSIVVALMARNTSEKIKTFSIGFSGDALFDETRYAREVARMNGTDHHEFKLCAQDMTDVLEEVLSAFDEPFSDSSAIPTYLVSRETRKYVTVALSGDGGDELFAGYRSYLAWYWFDRYMRIPETFRTGVLERLIDLLPDSRETGITEFARRLKKFVHGTKGDTTQRLLNLKEIYPSQLRERLIAPLLGRIGPALVDPALSHIGRFVDCFGSDPINRALYTDVCDSLPGDMLTKVDWMSMRNSLEVRVPFLDHRVVELAFSIPGDIKMKSGVTKFLLKEAFRSMLPQSLYRRPKAGFEIPISRWLRTDMAFLIDQHLNFARLRGQGIFDAGLVKTLVAEFIGGGRDNAWLLWNLIVFQSWYDRNFG